MAPKDLELKEMEKDKMFGEIPQHEVIALVTWLTSRLPGGKPWLKETQSSVPSKS